ncbi:MAG TPA: class I SAM-dependent methyltransferase [Pseudoalteromonas sp.]|jgi:tRNA (cmo5U34)-methyltransferase|uniref:SAM-dependent methyltransferase n=2 Tax=Pseudoalteromonas TaxID=53246 RepID=A0ABR5VSL6_9GAMM|nr:MULTISPECIES: class I SAM-dependent methyltransferase [Pseudoalteromonas]MCP4061252.1 class I SAM-dependent methyltransferase [Pseudoalteromonas sp.]MDY6889788.1 class I SAM-dependent methyltransferase [Pseudomonadota bacterium]GEK77404.1 SAM-dependent methyltransferase [Pseudoalteromonas atlantica]AZN34931.1 class I SAM-dependent methyltransferase [Pseudoalteromonas sp. Xi13]ETJ48132.1 SAM-dependent methyltransferase [Pseudoalteromonas agarivorans]|tara:strand:- start:9446 stop:10102 length:657 start_codon:yes stop_codon:yes gene_type:complete
MPTFTGEQATHYNDRITRLVPGYELLHQLTNAQLKATLKDNAHILVVGAGTGKEILALAALNPTWQFTAQDTSSDMLAIAKQAFEEHGIAKRVNVIEGELDKLSTKADAALCLLVMHFLKDDGSKKQLLKNIKANLNKGANLFISDLMKPETDFEREAQITVCADLGLSDAGQAYTAQNLDSEFYPLDRMRFSELLNECKYGIPKLYFKALGFSGYVV